MESFLFIGSHPVTDFANTQFTPSGEVKELLNTYEDILVWFQKAGLEIPKEKISETSRQYYFEEILAYREVIKQSFHKFTTSQKPMKTLMQTTNTILQKGDVSPEISLTEEGYTLSLIPKATSCNQLLVRLAIETARLLDGTQLSHLKKCGNHTCSLFFIDTSKNHSRRWCSMEVCGNRHKVNTFQKRKKSEN